MFYLRMLSIFHLEHIKIKSEMLVYEGCYSCHRNKGLLSIA